jgi:hypothetical protein
MGFFRTLKRLFQGYDITEGGSNPAPLNRQQRREEQRRLQKLESKSRIAKKKPTIQKYSIRKQKWNQRQKNRNIGM